MPGMPIRLTTTNPGAVPVYEAPSNGGALSVTLQQNNLGAMPVREVPFGTGGAVPIIYAPDYSSGGGGGGEVAPILTSAVVGANGFTVTLTFDMEVIGHEGFALFVSSESASLTYESGDGTTGLVFTSDRQVVIGEIVTLDYAPGDVVSVAGTVPLADISEFPVDNQSEVEP